MNMTSMARRAVCLAAILVIGCGSTPESRPQGGAPLSVPELKYRVMAAAGQPSFCGPPVERPGYEAAEAAAQFRTISADRDLYAAIVAHAAPAGDPSSEAYQVAVWREWRRLQAIDLSGAPPELTFRFHTADEEVGGSVTPAGRVRVTTRTPSRLMCPICLAQGTLIATPAGPVEVSHLRRGDLVWTATPRGRRAAPVLELGSTPFPLGREAIGLGLADGRRVTVSAPHPTGDGRSVGALQAGDSLDGSFVVAVARVHLGPGSTYDLLPAGSTGTYWADGILLGSSLRAAGA